LHLTGLALFFWALGLFEHCVLLAVLWLLRRATFFPIFTALIATNVVRTAVLYFILHFAGSESYFYVFWSFGFLDVTLQLAVTYELSRHVFQPLGAWASDLQRSFAPLAGASLLIASVLTWLATPATRTLRSAIVIRGNFFSSALMSALFVAMIVLSVTADLPWRTHVAGLAQGFGVYSIFGILTESAHSYFGTGKHAYVIVSQVRISLYCLCVAYWIFVLARDEPQPRKLPEEVRLEIRALQKRATMLLQSFRQSGRAS
jgi:hypothetical protein